MAGRPDAGTAPRRTRRTRVMVALRHGGHAVVVLPAAGGAIAGWSFEGTPVFQPVTPEAILLGHPGAMGCFPMVPWCNRIAQRRFAWNGRTHTLAANFGDSPHAIHGVGWRRAWTVEAANEASVTLSLTHAPDADWPFAFAARLTYALEAGALESGGLDDGGLTIAMAAENRAAHPAPMGIGAHPWFARHPDDVLAFEADGVWTATADALPDRHGPVPAAWSHSGGRAVAAAPLDHCFTGWHGEARCGRARLTADPVFGNLQVYTPANARFFCVEPVSHMPDALNRAPMDQPAARRPGANRSDADRLAVSRPDADQQDADQQDADQQAADQQAANQAAVSRREANRSSASRSAMAGQGMHVLAPGETLSGTIRFAPV